MTTRRRPARGQEKVAAAAPLPERSAVAPEAPDAVDDVNRFVLSPESAVKIHATAKLLGTDPSTAANGGAQFYHFLADLVAQGWILAGIDPEDGQTRPIEWTGFDTIQKRST